ncbi:PAS domain S-box-containing protein [Methanofollis sp. W23]|uniref:histidine kinase N-terminal 7TM domain-containing protein n=1 Tax=Methanofollis sp. W23 TaxID=2817849 RepID=UPI001AEB0ADC|nr:histidine kinase N-terminal 7TM domain-containing protein [Methanofollis sp. W23]MBP2145571.1 PAS domain S-box-containing protein [Methanofollis sp. W23]
MYTYISGTFAMVASLAIASVLAVATWKRREAPGARTFFLFALGVLIWLLGEGSVLLPLGPGWQGFWAEVTIIGIAVMTPAWMAFVMQYTGKEQRVTLTTTFLASVVPTAAAVLSLAGAVPVADLMSGTSYFVLAGAVYLVVIICIIFLVAMLLAAPAMYRRQIGFVLMGALIPWAAVLSPSLMNPSPSPCAGCCILCIMTAALTASAGALQAGLFGTVPLSKERYFNGLTDGIFVLDPQFRLVEMNRKGEEIVRHQSEELIGLPVAEFINHFPELQKGYRGTSEVAYVQSLTKKDGKREHYELRISPIIDWRSRTTGHFLLVRDISRLKETEDALRRAQKKASILNQISQHDIKNQLEVIIGYGGLLEELTPDGSEQKTYVRRIIEASEMIGEHLGAARDYRDLGLRAPEWQSVAGAAERTARILDHHGVTLEVEAGGLEIYADPLFGKVFYNLYENAIRHGGDVTAMRVSVSEARGENLIVVEDNGMGVAAAAKEKIFERKYGSHTGLGLFLTSEILSATGISIRECGVPGRGARFEIRVPSPRCRWPGPGGDGPG